MLSALWIVKSPSLFKVLIFLAVGLRIIYLKQVPFIIAHLNYYMQTGVHLATYIGCIRWRFPNGPFGFLANI